MRTWMIVIALGACGGSGASGPRTSNGPRDVWSRAPDRPTCATAGEMVEARVAVSDTAPAAARQLAPAATVERCTADAWSADAQACVSSPAMTFELCVRTKLTPEQGAAYEAALATAGCDVYLSCK